MLNQKEFGHMMGVLIGMVRQMKGGFTLDYEPRIKKNEIHVLMEVRNNPRRTISYYLNFIELESGSFTYVIDKLEKKDFLRRITDEADRRKTILELTDKGSQVTDELIRQVDLHLAHLMADLSDEDFTELNKAIDILENTLKKLRKD